MARAEASRPSTRPPASRFRPSVDLAGRQIALSGDIPAFFDAPLAPHHKLIGRWVASRETSAIACSRPQARWRIERAFRTAVLEVLEPVQLADLRVGVLQHVDDGPPAIAVICDSIGQLDLGWIETGDAPIPWRAAAYRLLERVLGRILPVFGYDDLFDHFSMYYWDGETEDEAARRCLVEFHGVDPGGLDGCTLPSELSARRPEWMITESAGCSKELPAGLKERMSKLSEAHQALVSPSSEQDAWNYEIETIYDYIPEFEDHSTLLPLTLVPLEQFARELDDMAQHGMELGFMDVCGLCQLPDAARLDDWFASLRAGAQFLLAAQELIRLDPAKL